jgi:hypothetical protein
MNRNKVKFIILAITVVSLCMACHRKDEFTEEKQWAVEYDIYRLPQKACLKS